MGIPERLALAVVESDLSWSDTRTKPVELVAALSATTNLGSDIHRAKDMDGPAFRRAILLLTKKAMDAGRSERLPLSRAQAQALSIAALLEQIAPHCRSCNGAAVVVVDRLKVVCSTCSGAGVHRYTDKERARICGIKAGQWVKWERRYNLVLRIARSHDTAQVDAAIRLG